MRRRGIIIFNGFVNNYRILLEKKEEEDKNDNDQWIHSILFIRKIGMMLDRMK